MIGRVAARIAAGACALVLAGCGGTRGGAGAPATAPTAAGGFEGAPTTAGPAPPAPAGPPSKTHPEAPVAPRPPRPAASEEAPWEVVGTHDTTLTLDTPAYGTAAGSPVAVGGEITGVDESLRVQVRSAGAARPLGDTCCLPAGGERQRWATTVTVHGRGLATIVVSTGGHVAEVERFAVTAVLLR